MALMTWYFAAAASVRLSARSLERNGRFDVYQGKTSHLAAVNNILYSERVEYNDINVRH